MGLLDILLGGSDNSHNSVGAGLGWALLDALLFNEDSSSQKHDNTPDKSAWDDPDWEEDEWEEEQ